MSTESDLIVCATDFSDEAASALDWAVAFARREGARIDLLHVLPEPTRDREQLAADAATFEAARLHDARERLAATAVAAGRAAGVTVQPQVLRGNGHVPIIEHARANRARAIVMGAGTRPMVERWVLGSVAERTVRSAGCPVVIVPRRERGQSWLGGEGDHAGAPMKALVGLEGVEGGTELIRFAADLRQRGRCDVTFLHLYWPNEEFARLGLHGARNPLEVDVDVVRNLEPKLRALTDGLPGEGRVTLDMKPAFGSPAANLAMAAEERAFDLLVVGAHQRHGLARVRKGSVAASLARQAARIPLVCVPVSAAKVHGAAVAPRLLTVLAPTDLSEIGNAAVPYAYALLRATGGVVELCFVHEHALPYPAFAYNLPDVLTDADRAQLETQLRALVPAEAEALGITTHVSIIDGGRAAEAIVAAAERLNVDAVNLGSHGRGGVSRAVLGSVAEAVVRHARRPVLVVPAPRVN
jgi:nucleotide-binding universal stress UspA family protein